MQSPVKLWRNQKRIQTLLGSEGIVVSWTMIYVPPGGFSSFAPYPLVIVELKDGKRITAQLVDYEPEQLKIGIQVKTVLRRIMEPSVDGVIPYGIKVTPLL